MAKWSEREVAGDPGSAESGAGLLEFRWIYDRVGQLFSFGVGGGLCLAGSLGLSEAGAQGLNMEMVVAGAAFLIVGTWLRHQHRK